MPRGPFCTEHHYAAIAAVVRPSAYQDPPLHWNPVTIELPPWVSELVAPGDRFEDDDARMRLAVRLARENVARRDGGPFGAAIFERDGGRIVGVGVNRVMPANNAIAHAETVAIAVAGSRVGRFSLDRPGGPEHDLFTSCEPCAMCLGAVLWSGVRRVVWAATREDAVAAGFEEGPVFPESHRYLEARGIELVRGLLRDEGNRALVDYCSGGGAIYNA